MSDCITAFGTINMKSILASGTGQQQTQSVSDEKRPERNSRYRKSSSRSPGDYDYETKQNDIDDTTPGASYFRQLQKAIEQSRNTRPALKEMEPDMLKNPNMLLPGCLKLRDDLTGDDRPTSQQLCRFLNKVTGDLGCSDACNRWMAKTVGGPRYKRGNMHGMFWFRNGMRLCHRLAYTWFVGDIPPGYEVSHTCDSDGNCVNPRHLKLRSKDFRCALPKRGSISEISDASGDRSPSLAQSSKRPKRKLSALSDVSSVDDSDTKSLTPPSPATTTATPATPVGAVGGGISVMLPQLPNVSYCVSPMILAAPYIDVPIYTTSYVPQMPWPTYYYEPIIEEEECNDAPVNDRNPVWLQHHVPTEIPLECVYQQQPLETLGVSPL